MPNYRRAFAPGATFFFTVVTYDRQPFLCQERAREYLRRAIQICQADRPFEIDALILLPDHLHAIWTLPEGDSDFSSRWGIIKKTFTQSWLITGGDEPVISPSRHANRRRGVWQRRFWEHLIRNPGDYDRHTDYIHYNAVKHGLARCPHSWPYSTFSRWCRAGVYDKHWACVCNRRSPTPPDFRMMDQMAME